PTAPSPANPGFPRPLLFLPLQNPADEAYFPLMPRAARGAPPNTLRPRAAKATPSRSRNRYRLRGRDPWREERDTQASRPRCKAEKWSAPRQSAAGDLRRRPAGRSRKQTRASARSAWHRARAGRGSRALRVACEPSARAVAAEDRVGKGNPSPL